MVLDTKGGTEFWLHYRSLDRSRDDSNWVCWCLLYGVIIKKQNSEFCWISILQPLEKSYAMSFDILRYEWGVQVLFWLRSSKHCWTWQSHWLHTNQPNSKTTKKPFLCLCWKLWRNAFFPFSVSSLHPTWNLRPDLLASRRERSVHRLPFVYRKISSHHCCSENQLFSSFQRSEDVWSAKKDVILGRSFLSPCPTRWTKKTCIIRFNHFVYLRDFQLFLWLWRATKYTFARYVHWW